MEAVLSAAEDVRSPLIVQTSIKTVTTVDSPDLLTVETRPFDGIQPRTIGNILAAS